MTFPFRRSLELLEQAGAHVAAAVTRLGTPVPDTRIETCRIVVSDRGLELEFNPRWARRLRVAELAGALAHEALHLVHGHPAVIGRMTDPAARHLYNLAADAVVNDLLRLHYPELELPPGAVRGRHLVGHDCSRWTAEQVFEQLQDRMRRGRVRVSVLLGLRTFDDHGGWLPLPAPFDRYLRRIARAALPRDRAYDDEAFGALRHVDARHAGVDLASAVLDRARRAETSSWTRPPRKLMAVYPELLLPSDQVERPSVCVAIDASGSVEEDLLGAFVGALRGARCARSMDLLAVSFDQDVYPLHDSSPRGGGGTSFQAIEDHMRCLARYPDVVAVLTDGEAPRPWVRHPDRWLWLIPALLGSTANVEGIGRIVRFDPPG